MMSRRLLETIELFIYKSHLRQVGYLLELYQDARSPEYKAGDCRSQNSHVNNNIKTAVLITLLSVYRGSGHSVVGIAAASSEVRNSVGGEIFRKPPDRPRDLPSFL
jgi:hypothetical protein